MIISGIIVVKTLNLQEILKNRLNQFLLQHEANPEFITLVYSLLCPHTRNIRQFIIIIITIILGCCE